MFDQRRDNVTGLREAKKLKEYIEMEITVMVSIFNSLFLIMSILIIFLYRTILSVVCLLSILEQQYLPQTNNSNDFHDINNFHKGGEYLTTFEVARHNLLLLTDIAGESQFQYLPNHL